MSRLLKNLAGALPRPLLFGAILASSVSLASQAKPDSVNAKDIAGVTLGMKLEDVRERLKSIGSTSNLGEYNARRQLKEAWTLNDSPFKTIAYKASEKKGISWVTGWVREGKEIPFTSLGDLKSAARSNQSQVIWNVSSPDGNFRLVAKGVEGKANVVSLFALETKNPG